MASTSSGWSANSARNAAVLMSVDSTMTPSKSKITASKRASTPGKAFGIRIFLRRYRRAERLSGQETDRLLRRLDLHAGAAVGGHRSHVAGETHVGQLRERSAVGLVGEHVERRGTDGPAPQGAR